MHIEKLTRAEVQAINERADQRLAVVEYCFVRPPARTGGRQRKLALVRARIVNPAAEQRK